jgi:hypothetical protein
MMLYIHNYRISNNGDSKSIDVNLTMGTPKSYQAMDSL